jgi:hypothetical protein
VWAGPEVDRVAVGKVRAGAVGLGVVADKVKPGVYLSVWTNIYGRVAFVSKVTYCAACRSSNSQKVVDLSW